MAVRPKIRRKKRRVIVYSTPTCSYCNMAKQYFDRHKVSYRDVDVSHDQAAAQELARRTGQMGVPVIDINGKLVVGFNKPKINKLLNIKRVRLFLLTFLR